MPLSDWMREGESADSAVDRAIADDRIVYHVSGSRGIDVYVGEPRIHLRPGGRDASDAYRSVRDATGWREMLPVADVNALLKRDGRDRMRVRRAWLDLGWIERGKAGGGYHLATVNGLQCQCITFSPSAPGRGSVTAQEPAP